MPADHPAWFLPWSMRMLCIAWMSLAVASQGPTVEDFGRGLRWESAELPVTSGVTGGAVAGIVSPGDVDGDGVPDLVTVSSIPDSYQGFTSVDLVAISSADDSILWSTAFPAHPGSTMQLEPMGDLDGDGILEVVVGAPRWPYVASASTGEVFVYSGGTGALLLNIAGTNHAEEFGSSCAGIEDLDGDGVPDLLVGATEYEQAHWSGLPGVGFVAAYSGATGQEIYRVASPVRGSFYAAAFGAGIAVLSDVDGDGLDDYLVGTPEFDDFGMITLHSGADGRVLRRWVGRHAHCNFGRQLAAIGDVDGDGLREFVTIASTGTGTPGSLRVHSPVLADPLMELPGFGFVPPTPTPDLDGDGQRDLLAWSQPGPTVVGHARLIGSQGFQPLADFLPSASYSNPRQVGMLWIDPRNGEVEVVAPFHLTGTDARTNRYYRIRCYQELALTPRRLSVAALPATVTIAIDLSASHGGESYLLLLSTDPQGPRQVLGVDVPLGPSPLLTQSLLGTVPGLTGGSGALDAEGDAAASLLVAAPNPAGLAGLDVYFSVLAHVGLLGTTSSSPAVLRLTR